MPRPPLSLHRRLQTLAWPLPAALAWAAGWGLWLALAPLGAAPALAAALLGSCTLALLNSNLRRRLIAAGGFPLSAAALGMAGSWPAWAWLLLLVPLLAAYPVRAWRDAPFFPTPADALQGLDGIVGAAPLRALDAGCGLGHGLQALHRLWPQTQLSGIEWSLPLAWAAALRCRFAGVRRGDMWGAPWTGYDLVYVFQRPESMLRAYEKARAELAPGGWLVSLEFAVPGRRHFALLQGPGRRPLWVYRMPSPATGNSTGGRSGR